MSHDQDLEHLRLLSIFHYVVGGIAAAISLVFLLHLGLGLLFLLAPGTLGEEAPPRAIGCLMMGFGAGAILLGWTFAGLLVYAGRCLAQRRHYTFCLVMAALSILFQPLGTVLGIFTLIVLLRPSVQELFQVSETATPTV